MNINEIILLVIFLYIVIGFIYDTLFKKKGEGNE